jgi:hypothetical protein
MLRLHIPKVEAEVLKKTIYRFDGVKQLQQHIKDQAKATGNHMVPSRQNQETIR